ncbi:MAG: GNAT family N-acetyltransferase [Cyanobacteria bacterium P01_A01_bin.123]
MEIRQAEEKHITAICSFDHLAQIVERRRFIQNSVRSGTASVAVLDGQVVGYAVLEYSFFAQGFMAMLYIHPEHRRKGIGSEIVRYVESICKTEKLFTSTNESNLLMQALMAKLR